MNLKIKLEVIGNETTQLTYDTSTSTVAENPTVADLISLIDSTTAWLNKQKTELEKFPQTEQLSLRSK